ncbi:hypothetical protein D3C73_1395830 [compost metagenome]
MNFLRFIDWQLQGQLLGKRAYKKHIQHKGDNEPCEKFEDEIQGRYFADDAVNKQIVKRHTYYHSETHHQTKIKAVFSCCRQLNNLL